MSSKNNQLEFGVLFLHSFSFHDSIQNTHMHQNFSIVKDKIKILWRVYNNIIVIFLPVNKISKGWPLIQCLCGADSIRGVWALLLFFSPSFEKVFLGKMSLDLTAVSNTCHANSKSYMLCSLMIGIFSNKFFKISIHLNKSGNWTSFEILAPLKPISLLFCNYPKVFWVKAMFGVLSR